MVVGSAENNCTFGVISPPVRRRVAPPPGASPRTTTQNRSLFPQEEAPVLRHFTVSSMLPVSVLAVTMGPPPLSLPFSRRFSLVS